MQLWAPLKLFGGVTAWLIFRSSSGTISLWSKLIEYILIITKLDGCLMQDPFLHWQPIPRKHPYSALAGESAARFFFPELLPLYGPTQVLQLTVVARPTMLQPKGDFGIVVAERVSYLVKQLQIPYRRPLRHPSLNDSKWNQCKATLFFSK